MQRAEARRCEDVKLCRCECADADAVAGADTAVQYVQRQRCEDVMVQRRCRGEGVKVFRGGRMCRYEDAGAHVGVGGSCRCRGAECRGEDVMIVNMQVQVQFLQVSSSVSVSL